MKVLLILVFLALSAVLSAAETALSSISRARLQQMLEEVPPKGELLSSLLQHPQKLLSTILVGDTITDVAIIVLVSHLIEGYVPDPWGFMLAVLVATFLIFTIGGVLPKAYAARHIENVALALARPMQSLITFFAPVVWLMSLLTGPFLAILGGRFGQVGPRFSEAEIRTMVDLGEEVGILEETETRLIQSAFAFNDTLVGSVMTPRVDMGCLSIDCTLGEALDELVQHSYSRMPIYEETLDNIVGIVTLKDLLLAQRQNPDSVNSPIQFYMRPAYHVPENKLLDELLKEMQLRRMQMAIVSDEYGGTAGLATLEDILEQIVGEIRDEHDYDEQPQVQEIAPYTLLVDARAGIDVINNALKVNLPNNQTVGGLVFNSLGHVPQVGETVRLSNVLFQVEEVQGIRVQKVKIQKQRNGTSELTGFSRNGTGSLENLLENDRI